MTHGTHCTCGVMGISYNFATKEGLIFAVEEGCRMTESCIDIFLKVDPEVLLIHIFVGGTSDVICIRKNDSWSFRDAQRSQPLFPTEWSEVRH